MDNLTHSLVGAALSELAAPEDTTRAGRRVFFAAGILASNLPDIDVLYASRVSAPVGFLLHHRGHTHTLVGEVVLGLLLAAALRLVPGFRSLASADRKRLWVLIVVSLLGHLLLDSWNSYGVHPFYPFDARWYYGDAVFIFEPWLCVLLGVSAAWNARARLARFATAALVVLALAAVGYVGAVSPGVLTALSVSAAVSAWSARSLAARTRSVAALAAGCVLVACLFGLSRVARGETLAQLPLDGGAEVVDVILSPDPAAPWCWTTIAIARNATAGEFVLRRGTLSLLPGWQPPASCVSHRLVPGADLATSPDGSVLWRDEIRQTLASLRELNARDCWARAWLQFGRAPFMRDGALRDLRFENRLRSNFSALKLEPREPECPAHMTSWAQPRADLLAQPR
jgi:inner membrane protein